MQARGDGLERLPGVGPGPVQVLEHEHERCHAAPGGQHTGQGLEEARAFFLRVKRRRRAQAGQPFAQGGHDRGEGLQPDRLDELRDLAGAQGRQAGVERGRQRAVGQGDRGIGRAAPGDLRAAPLGSARDFLEQARLADAASPSTRTNPWRR
jgi:hypothetical protein